MLQTFCKMKNLLIYKDASIKKALELIKKSGVKGLVVINKNNQIDEQGTTNIEKYSLSFELKK